VARDRLGQASGHAGGRTAPTSPDPSLPGGLRVHLSINPSLLPAYAVAVAFGYFCGSIPFGLILTQLAGTPDIRSIGSRSIGATNVLRTGRKGLAAATLLGDALKGTAAVLLVYAYYGPEYRYFGHELAIPAALGAVLGHVFPIWLGFKGGKGVATYIGVLIGLAWPAALAFCLVWLAIAAISRYSSLAALGATAVTPVVVFLLGDPAVAALFAVLTVLVWIMHRGNIARLINGTESKIGKPTTSGA
jgi:acyl phosphate:glycerol-3-phosphate acyltransferase